MNKKVKIISICVITIIMIIGVKFGGQDEQYLVDFEINRLHSQANDSIVSLEANTNAESYQLQEDILKAREYIEEFRSYAKDHFENDYYADTIASWSIRMDSIQQIVLTRVVDSINRAKEVRSIKAINEAKSSIPSNMPSKWKDEFEKDINSIES